jgi:hypothetical protein
MQREIEVKNQEIREKDLAVVELSAALDVIILQGFDSYRGQWAEY